MMAGFNHENRRRATLLIALLFGLVVAMVARIYWVNEYIYPYPYPTVHHGMNEWVELDGAFIESASEDTNGYRIRVTEARRLSLRDYVDLYGKDDAVLDVYESTDAKSILCLTVDLRNDRTDDEPSTDAIYECGSIFLGEAKLVSDNELVSYTYDGGLWKASNPNIDKTSFYIGVLPGTQTTQYVPYSIPVDGERYTNALPDSPSYALNVSNAPVHHVIDLIVAD